MLAAAAAAAASSHTAIDRQDGAEINASTRTLLFYLQQRLMRQASRVLRCGYSVL